MAPVTYAALTTAKTAESLTALLSLLDPPGEEQRTALDQLLELVARIAESQARIERRLDAIELRLGARSDGSHKQRPTGS
jgi:hypothetical protein